MKSQFVDASASATNPKQPGAKRLARSIFKAAILAGSLLGGGLIQSANATLVLTTTGTIQSGSETGGLFGLPTATTSLAGSSYTLIVNYNRLGPNYYSTGNGSFAQDNETPGTAGYVTAIINGHSLTTTLSNSLGSSLIADLYDFIGANQGYNGSATTGAYVNVLQELSCSNACVPYANLSTNFSYTLTPADFGTDLFTYQGAGFPTSGAPMANFIGTERTFAAAPEPASWILLATGLFALGMVVRRGRA